MSQSTNLSNEAPTKDGPESRQLDLSEKGRRAGEAISLDRRLFMKFTAFGHCDDPAPVIEAVKRSGVDAAVYVDANDPNGIAIMAASEDPDTFVGALRDCFHDPAFGSLVHKAEFDMLGRSYSIGYESDLEDTLLARPRRRLLDPALEWVVWYPLRRAKIFQTLPEEKQMRILGEHGTIAKRYGIGNQAADIRLACHGLDKNDNDFIIGLLGPRLFPLSHVVQSMRKTEQTSQYLESLGPFFVGKVVWQNAAE